MKIVEVLLRPAIGGAETLVEQLSRHWRAAGHQVDVVYLDPDGDARGARARVTGLAAALRRSDPDVVHAHSALPNLYARLVARGRWPVVTVLHSAERDFDDRTLRAAERALRHWTASVVAVSPGQIAEYTARFGADRAPVLVPNGIRPDLRPRVPAPGPLRAVAVSRLAEQKRIDVLLEGWRRAGLDGGLRIAGVAADPHIDAQVNALAAGIGSVRLLGRVDDVPGLLAGADLLVHAADAEAHPLAPIEAACAGLPVVVSDAVAGTLPEEVAAVRFATGDPASLAAALTRAAAGYPELAAAAAAVAPAVAARFSLATCADAHLRVLEAAVRRPEPVRSRAARP